MFRHQEKPQCIRHKESYVFGTRRSHGYFSHVVGQGAARPVFSSDPVVETKGDNEQRYRWKLILIKRLYRQGYAKADVIRLFAFIDWVMSLPADMEKGLWTEIQKFEEETKMEYVTSVERIGIEKGMEKGSLNLLCRLIAKRFKTGSESLPPIFTGLRAEDIEDLGERFLDAESVDEIRRWAEEKRRARMQ